MTQHSGGPQMPQHGQVPSYSTESGYPAGSRGGAGPAGPGGMPTGSSGIPPSGPGWAPHGSEMPPGPPPQGQEPGKPRKRSWFARHKFLTVLLGVGVFIVLVVAINSQSSDGEDTAGAGQEPAQAQDAANAEQAGDGQGAEEQSGTDAEPADTSAEEAPAVDEAILAARENSAAQETTLGAGTFTVGEDVPPGRYVIAPQGEQSGNLTATDADGALDINEVLGDAMGMGVPSVTDTLAEGTQIEISGLSAVTFTPAETEASNTLTTGDWVAGLDIEPGDYVVTPAKGQSGNFIIYDEFGLPKTNEILGDAGGLGVPDVTVSLSAGDRIEISGLGEVTFADE